jgi:hypothetical protein
VSRWDGTSVRRWDGEPGGAMSRLFGDTHVGVEVSLSNSAAGRRIDGKRILVQVWKSAAEIT